MKHCTGVVATLALLLGLLLGASPALSWTAVEVKKDPLVRMPGTQPVPENAPDIENPSRCTNCHGGYDQAIEPTYNWQGSMMAQAARDFLFYACMTTAAQDSIWAVGNPNATDICARCHFPQGWLEGRSDPTNASLMTGADFDGVHCDFCHSMFDPFFETTFDGSREGSDWRFYWDEAGALSGPAAVATHAEDARLARLINLFNGGSFFTAQAPLLPPDNYVENASGQFFVDDARDKRASFADANARHPMFYSRYHKSKYFCATCHDVSNPVLANAQLPGLPGPLDDGSGRLITEQYSAYSYFHVERTFSEFMLSAYGQQGGSAGIGPFSAGQYTTSRPDDVIATCQDCHMRDGVGKAASQKDAVLRPTGSSEHPQSGQPIHDLTGGNAWVSTVLASAVSGSPNYDAVNDGLLNQGPDVLTLDLRQGLGIDPAALLAGADRAMQQLQLAASINSVVYDETTGALNFQIQNQTGHKLISGFPEGRRMFINIQAYDSNGLLIHEINPYDYAAGTLKGLGSSYDGLDQLPNPAPLAPNEAYVDELVYEAKPSSIGLTGEDKTFHFALATGRYKDNRIPPKGFAYNAATGSFGDKGLMDERLITPAWGGGEIDTYFTQAEYAGGFDEVRLTIPANAAQVDVKLYYQTTSREYIEFLRDEINGYRDTNVNQPTLTSPTLSGETEAYIIQSDPFFAQLKAWGNTIWQLWTHNMNLTTAAPFLMTSTTVGGVTPPPPLCEPAVTPLNLVATGLKGKKVELIWDAVDPLPTGGYNLYYDQAGKLSFIASVPAGDTNYTDSGLLRKTTYSYVVTSWNDCDGDGIFTPGVDNESPPSQIATATTQ